MKMPSKLLIATAIAASGAVASSALFAEQAKTKAPVEEKVVVSEDSIQASDAARSIVGMAREARIALFDGQTDLAKELTQKARSEFKQGLEKYAIKDGKLGYVVPLDSGLAFAEGFQPKEEHAASITAAGELMQNGDIKQAMSVMTKAGVELDISAVVMPVKATREKLDEVISDIDKGEFYAANLALKSIESAIEMRPYDPQSLPIQGYSVTEVL